MRRALVTGANGGLGGAIARRLLRDGWAVHAVVRGGAARLDDDVAGHPGMCVHDVELTDLVETPRRLVDAPLHGLVNVAGASVYGSAADVPVAAVRDLLALNVLAPAALVQAHIDPLVAGGGTVVQISSLSAALPLPWMGAYAASKRALEAWSESLRHELRPLGVGVVCLRPGTYRTGVARRLRLLPPSRPSQQPRFDAFAALVERSLDRAADPQEVGDAVLALLTRPPSTWRRGIGPGSWALPWLLRLPGVWRDALIDRVLTLYTPARTS